MLRRAQVIVFFLIDSIVYSFAAGALASLGAMISAPNSRSTSESVTATENAISAVVKILKYNSSMVDASKVSVGGYLEWRCL